MRHLRRLFRRLAPTPGPEKQAPDQQVELRRMGEDDSDVEMNGEHRKMKGNEERCSKETLLAKYERITSVAIPGSIFSTSFIYIVQKAVNGKFVGEVKVVVGVAEISFVLAMLSALATWLLAEMWKSDVDAASDENKPSASSENKGAAISQSKFEERIGDFSLRYMRLVIMRATYLSCWLVGLFFVLSDSSLLNWIVSGLAMLLVIGIAIYQIYGAYQSYSSLPKPVIVVKLVIVV